MNETAAGALQFVIREEAAGDADAIEALTRAAFRDHPFSSQTEHLILRGLRAEAALKLSLVAVAGDAVLGHLALSPVRIDARATDWWGLGPLAVLPSHQRRGIGAALVRSALRRMREAGLGGCVVLGDPDYYRRFGFAPRPGLIYPGPPPAHFMALALSAAPPPIGEVTYHPAFALPP